jgi:diguanylate cyclase (GGDEF)-like protein
MSAAADCTALLARAQAAAESEPAAAVELAQAALAAARDSGDLAATAAALLVRAGLLLRQARYEAAYEDARAALDIGRQRGDPVGMAQALRTIGHVHDDLGDYAVALEHHLQALAHDDGSGHAVSRANTLRTIGIVYSKAGDPRQGLAFYEQSLALTRSAGDLEATARTLNNIGINLKNLGELDRSRLALEEALVLFERLRSAGGQAGALSNLGLTFEKLGCTDEAERCQRRAVEFARRAGYAMAGVKSWRALGELLTQVGRLDEAAIALAEALAIAEAMGARPERALCHRALAEMHKRAGRGMEALAHFEAFHRLDREVFNEESDRKLRSLQIRHRVAQLERQSLEDGLTGLHNRRYLDAALAEAVHRALREGRPLAVALADLDDFKRINDRFSHIVGDAVLRAAARALREHCRAGDAVARYGGEEFALLLPDTDAAGAAHLCEKLRRAVAEFDWRSLHPELAVTLSIGVAGLDVAADAVDVERLLARADQALYRAKAAGKNRVVAG